MDPTMPSSRPVATGLTVPAASAWLVCLLAAAAGTLTDVVVGVGDLADVALGMAVAAAVAALGIRAVAEQPHRAERLPEPLAEPIIPPTDPLTGLVTEAGLDLAVAALAATAVPYSVVVCDIDALTDYNDQHGSAVGNHALRFMAEVLDTTFRPSDVIARTEGDEFVAVLAGVSAIETSAACDRVREALALRLYDGTNIPHFRTSFGVSDTTGDVPFAETADAARRALAQAKVAGGNRVTVAGEAILLAAPPEKSGGR